MCMVFVQVLLEMWVQGSLNVDYVAIIIQEAVKKEISPLLSYYRFFFNGMTFTAMKFLNIIDNFLVVGTVLHNKWNQHSLFWSGREWCMFTTISSDWVVGWWMWEWSKCMAKQLYMWLLFVDSCEGLKKCNNRCKELCDTLWSPPYCNNVCQVEQLICGTICISTYKLCCTLSPSKGNVLIVNWRPLLLQCLCLLGVVIADRLVQLLFSIVVTVICDHCTETLTSLMVTIIEFTSQRKYLKCWSSMTNSRALKSVQTTDIEKFAWTVFLPLSCILDITPDFDLICPVKDGLWGHC